MKGMKPMPDKEFDQIFQKKFESFEVEPSAGMWEELADRFDQNNNKHDHAFMMRIAAILLAVLAATMWFAPRDEKVWLSKDLNESLLTQKDEGFTPAEKSQVKAPDLIPQAKMHKPVREAYNNPKTRQQAAAMISSVALAERETIREHIQIKPTASVEEEFMQAGPIEKPQVLAMVSEEETAGNEKKAEGQPIKSIGGLVNFVVSKVDRRKDKIIEFQDTDEGTFLSGLNLGIVKIKTHN